MRTTKSRLLFSACLAAFALPQWAAAQQKSMEVPPKLEKLEEGSAPAATVPDPEAKTRIIEKRERGEVTSVRVESGNSTYYLKPNRQAGSAAQGDVQGSTTRAPQWQILEFDWSRKPEKAGEAASKAATVPPPPAPPAPAQKQ